MIFVAPWVLSGLVALPLLWWLLRVTPPAPRSEIFPAVRFLLGLNATEETPAHTPWWLLALRIAAAGLVIVALARPVLDAGTALTGKGPVLLVVDNGWASANDWVRRKEAAGALLDRAERAGRRAALLTTAPDGSSAPVAVSATMPVADLRARLAAMQPQPWPSDRAASADAMGAWHDNANATVIYVPDGLTDGADFDRFAAAMRKTGPVTEICCDTASSSMLLPPTSEADRLVAHVAQAPRATATEASILAQSGDGRTLARTNISVAAGASVASGPIPLPPELRNRLTRLVLEGPPSAGSVVLLDERWRRRPVGLLSGDLSTADTPFTGSIYFLKRALEPFTELREGDTATLLKRDISVLVLADRPLPAGAERDALEAWVRKGGLLIRFAGQRTAEAATNDTDTLMPVRLLAGDRQLGGALSWNQPAGLAALPSTSPFTGLPVTDEIKVTRQVLAEPSADLAGRTWAALEDGTPLVTEAPEGAGRVVLFHVTANADWSNLPLSGLFVEILRRLVDLSVGVASKQGTAMLAPAETLDGFGLLSQPPPAATGLRADKFASTPVSPRHPPGLYGPESGRQVLNLGTSIATPEAAPPIAGATLETVRGSARERALGPPLLALAILLLCVDMIVSLALRGLLRARVSATVGALLLLVVPAAHALDVSPSAAIDTRLGYILSGDSQVDGIAKAGLEGLSEYVNQRTAASLFEPDAVQPGQTDLSLYPLLYWPVTADTPDLTTAQIAALNDYMSRGGIILIDTRNSGSGAGFAPGTEDALHRIARSLIVPPLAPLTGEHVLSRAFYLMSDFPGRFTGDTVWVQRDQDRTNDSVSPVIIGGNDWAAAWAVSPNGNNPYAVIPGGQRQRTLAYRFGVNLVMYALTGNYKGDQVHVPAILQRLGQQMRPDQVIAAIRFDPLLPESMLIALGILSLAVVALGLWRQGRGTLFRLAAFAVLLLWLTGPRLVQETRESLRDIGLLVVDQSASMQVGDRAHLADAARQSIEAQAGHLPDLELRTITVPETGNAGTQLFAEVDRALADIPRSRFAGTIAITDGQIHDVPKATPGSAPMNLLLTARGEETDRRLRVIEAPGYGIVGKSVILRVAIDDLGTTGRTGPATLAVRRDGQHFRTESVPVGVEQHIEVPITRAGPTVIEMSASPLPGEVSQLNNRAVVEINGVRDRLRVLLISGEPHQGERTWRRLLKADPSVDLVHFTILRPPEKDDRTPLNELALIAFPVRELFVDKIGEFDLIILDRFQNRGLLPLPYLANIAGRVRQGGALLMSVGPEFTGATSLASTPLGSVLPGGPARTNAVVDGPFRPWITDVGQRHPVTEGLPGANPPGSATKGPDWGPWYRRIEPGPVDGQVLMRTPDGQPLLALDRAGQGRTALLLSDQIWLWSRGHDGGGPQAELLRRIAHWLMQEPELEENALTARVADGRLRIESRSTDPGPPADVVVTDPDGKKETVKLHEESPGRATAARAAPVPGVWQVSQGTRSAYAAAGAANPPELADLRATAGVAGPMARASGGGVHWLAGAEVPELRRTEDDRSASGSAWIGLQRRHDHVVTGVAALELLPGWLSLPVMLGLLVLAWRREGR